MDADERARLINAAAAAAPMPAAHTQPQANPAAMPMAAPMPAAAPAPAGGRPGRGGGAPGTARIGRMGGPPGSPIAPQIAFGDPNNPFAVPPEFAGQEAPSGPPVRVRGARQVSGPGQGASVQMTNARPNPGATVQAGGGVAMQGRAPAPTPVPTGAPAPTAGGAWVGEHGIPRVAPSAATRPTVDVTIILSQHRRPMHLEKQIRMIQSSTVAPASMACFVNPVPGVQINDGLLQGIPKLRADRDMGPWWRWILAKEAGTRYVLMLDDDCVFGPQWLQKALERITLAEQNGQAMVIAAGGVVFREDNHKSGFPIGPEAPPPEQVVDIGRGAWLMPIEVLRAFDEFPRLGSQVLTTALHLAAVLQREQIPTVVLEYPLDNRAAWGMSSAPDPNGSMSQFLDQLSKQGRGYPADYHREEAYAVYRAAGWKPLVVAASEDTLRTTPSELGPPPPVVAPPGPSATAPA